MNVNLLYEYKDWTNTKSYFDWYSIVQDLRLDAIFDAAERDVVFKNGKAMYVYHEDPFLKETMNKVMRVPLETKEEILYRQEVMKDAYDHEVFIQDFYEMIGEVLQNWDKLGRKNQGIGVRETQGGLITEIRVLKLLVNAVADTKKYLHDHIARMNSRGFQNLYNRLKENFTDEFEEQIFQIMEDLSFYLDVSDIELEKNEFKMGMPLIRIDCNIADGLKFGDMKLETFETKYKNFTNPYGLLSIIQGSINSAAPNMIALYRNTALQEDAAALEFQTVNYVISACKGFMNEFSQFFDQLYLQLGFYRGAINIRHHLQRFYLDYCFPTVGEHLSLSFTECKELVLAMEEKGKAVGNDCDADGKLLAIITGANQGGKSTFLRSIGIAQVMMQCGLVVCAKSYKSGIYPNFFTHFTRREDSAMNSGRLDEELRRMDHIVNHIGEGSLLLLNESFASTTEKEGSMICYDIVKALKEQNVKILTVTHLLSFAQQVYDETTDLENSDIAFLSAERLYDGERTFKMIPHEPELTSFGLDLYKDIVEKRK